jgi:phytoene dehydrogenase-like protein
MTGQRQKVVVVGAGLAGLTAAATAARGGADVTVVEAREHEGGRARTRVIDGFSLNQGAHALYRGGPAWDVLTGFGIEPRGRAPDASHARGLRADGRLGPIPTNAATMLRSSVISAGAKLELAALLARANRLPRTVESGSSMEAWIERQVRHDDARSFLAMFARVATYCGDLQNLDATAGVAQLLSALRHGVLYLDGGWQQLVDALRGVVVEHGATIRAKTKAHAVEAGSAGIVVRTADGDIRSDTVVFANGGPDDVASLLQGASHDVTRWAAQARPVVVSALDVALHSLPDPSHRLAFGFEEPMYLSVHTPFANLAPNGGEVVHLLWYGESKIDPRPRLEALFDRVQPGWRERLVAERYARRLVVTHARPEPGRGTAARPACVVADLPGVLVAGDWVGPDGMLADASFASGRGAGLAAVCRPAPMVPAS